MKLDLHLIREILSDTEETPPGQLIHGYTYEGRSEAEILEHVHLLIEEGYLDGEVMNGPQGFPLCCTVHRLTMRGHEFIRNARNATVWERVISSARERGDSISMTVLNGLLSKAAEKYFGL